MTGGPGPGSPGWPGGHPRQLFAATVREEPVDLAKACLLLAAEFDPDLDGASSLAPWLDTLDLLAARVRGADRVAALRAVLAGFHGTPADYGELDSSLLHRVLQRRRGLPILLSVVWVEVGRRAGVPISGVGLPGHFVVAIDEPGGDHLLLDPYVGGTVWTHRGPDDEAADRPWGSVEILQRILANIRVWAAGPQRLGTRLAAVELALLLPHHSLWLRRERGHLLLQRGDFLGGAAALEAYAATVEPADPVAGKLARAQARAARARLN